MLILFTERLSWCVFVNPSFSNLFSYVENLEIFIFSTLQYLKFLNWFISFFFPLNISQSLTECGPLEEGMANHFRIPALRTPWTVWKGKMIGYWKRNSPGQQVPNMLLEISGEITPERMKGWSQSKNNTQLWMRLVIEARSNAVKSNTA